MRFSRIIVSLVSVLLFAVPLLAQRSGEPVSVTSSNNYGQTVQKFKDAVVGMQMMLISEADHQMMLKMVQTETKPSITILFGRPQMGAMLIKAEPKAALEMPMRVNIREMDDGKTYVYYYRPSYLFAHYRNRNLDQMGKDMDMMVQKLVDAATK